MRFTRRVTLLLAPLLVLVAPLVVSAQVTLLPPCVKTGDCAVSDILSVGVNLAEFLLSIMGALALAMFILGGFYWVFSGGEQKMVQKGKDTVRNAVIGIVIILFSGVIIRFASEALTGGKSTIPLVGASCDGGAGIYVEIPAGIADDGVTVLPDAIMCVHKNAGATCDTINQIMAKRKRIETYQCVSTGTAGLQGCVRGLCSGSSDAACCTRNLTPPTP